MDKQDILADLNKEQRQAVTHDAGPLLIIAGAGTGKTRVITRRIAHLIASGKCQPNEILALTFTDKAALEMEERADILIPYGYADIWVSTFHAFGERVLTERALDIGLDPKFKVLTQPEQAIFIKEHLFEFPLDYHRPLGNPDRHINALVTLFSRARDEDINPDDYLAYAKKLKKKSEGKQADKELKEIALKEMELALSYKKYQELKSKEGMVDFGDQFYLVLEMFRKHPAILKEYQQQFKYILVDEFQDTNYAQFELVKLLAKKHKNIAVSADDDQSIYKFRGAAVSNVLGFLKTYKKAKKIVLTKNYRSSQIILDTAYRLIKHNDPDRLEVRAGVNKKLKSTKKAGLKPQHLHFDTISHEADKVAEIIEKEVRSKKRNFEDFAVLVRSNNDAEPFLQALNLKSIPWRFTGNQGLYSREEIRLAVSFLRLLSNLSDSLSLYYLASSEIYSIAMETLIKAMVYARRKNIGLYYILKDIEQIPEFEDTPEKELNKIKRLLGDITHFLEASRSAPAGNVLYMFLTETGYLRKLTRQASQQNEGKIKNLAKFFEIVKEFSSLTEDDRVAVFVNHLDLLIDSGDDPAVAEADLDIPAVNVLTVHKAKGLEFPVVFIVSLVEGRFPWPMRKDPISLPDELIKDILPSGNFHLQEERRLFYVAMTRAKDTLYFTSARDYGGKRPRKVSRFILEALKLSKTDFEPYKSSALEEIGRHKPPAEKKYPKSARSRKKQETLVDLTAYKIDDYLTCPLKYKYIHILNIPILRHHTIIYGKILHDVVGEYFSRKMKGQKVALEDLFDFYERIWVNEGYLSKDHEEKRYRIGKNTIKGFYEREEKIDRIPTLIEEPFKIILDDKRLSGRWDRIDEGKETVIIDYKSSNIKEQSKADKRTKESIQLGIYSLAYQEIKGKLPERVELHFLESGLIGAADVKSIKLDKIKEVIAEVARGIRQEDFKAKPTYQACRYCPYNQICPFTKSN